MPTVLRVGPYRLFFFSDEGREPPHIHVAYERWVCKVWLNELTVAESGGLPAHRLRDVLRIVKENRDYLADAYIAFHHQ